MLTTAAPVVGPGPGAAECRAAARTGDPRRAWQVLLARTGATDPVLGPRGHGLRPAAADRDMTVAGTGWQVLRAAGPDTRPAGWLPALARCRLGLSEWLLAQAVDHLRERTSGGVPLLRHQLVRGALADVVIVQQQVLGLLDALASDAPAGDAAVGDGPAGDGPAGDGAAGYLHAQLTAADRITLRLLGASGFLAGGPGQVAYLSELLADAYLDPPGGSPDAEDAP